MRREQLVRHVQVRVRQAVGDQVGGVLSPGEHRRDVRLVDRADVADAVLHDGERGLGVAGEQVGGVVGAPEAVALEPARHGEVHQGDDRFDAGLVAGLDHAAVVVDLGAGDVTALGLDAGPLDAEPVGVQAEVGGDADVLAVPVVAVRGVAGGFDDGGVGFVLVHPPVRVDVVALDLVGGGGGTPEEAVGELQRGDDGAFQVRAGACRPRKSSKSAMVAAGFSTWGPW